MESTFLRDVRKVAEAYDKKLRANDPRFRRQVHIIHEDGSVTNYDSAFLMKIADKHVTMQTSDYSYWIVCFTEHHGLHINHSDDLLLYWESQKLYLDIEEIK